MTSSETLTAARLQERLQPRLLVEADFERLGHSYRHGPLHRFYDHKIQRPLLTVGLSLVGLFAKGKRNALAITLRHVTLEFANLPAAFDGFRLMQLADLHIDGVDGLAEALAAFLPAVP